MKRSDTKMPDGATAYDDEVTSPAPDSSRSEPPGPAVPSLTARVLAFSAIVVAGVCGGLIGYAVVDLQSSVDGGLAPGIGGLVGAAAAAGGVAIVAVLTLRAMSEWRTVDETRRPPDPDR